MYSVEYYTNSVEYYTVCVCWSLLLNSRVIIPGITNVLVGSSRKTL